MQIPGTIQDSIEEAEEVVSGLDTLDPRALCTQADLHHALEKMDKCLRVAQKVQREIVDCMPSIGSLGSQNSLTLESDKIAHMLGGKLQVRAVIRFETSVAFQAGICCRDCAFQSI